MTSEPLAYVDQQVVSVRDMGDLIAKVETALAQGDGFTLYTLNLDHLVKRRQDRRFRELYARATLVTADGWPVVTLARRYTRALNRTTGADMVLPLCRLAARCRAPVALFGTSQAILERAATRLKAECPGLEIAASEAPPFGFDPLGAAGLAAASRIRQSGARICFVALGAPKQEFFSDQAFAACPSVGFVCVGAALDFLAGAHRRAPWALQKIGLEWAWRLMLQPRRLGARYLRCGLLFVGLLLSAERPALTGRRVKL